METHGWQIMDYSTFNYSSQYRMEDEILSFVDFLPGCLNAQCGCCTCTGDEYDDFRSLVERANEWLRANPEWEVKTCETVDFKEHNRKIMTQEMIHMEYGKGYTFYIRGLRIWVVKGRNSGTSQQIGHLNVVPQQTEAGGIFSSPSYENLDEVIDKFNATIRTSRTSGRILKIESQKVQRGNDPDRSNWHESGNYRTHFVSIIRIFYEISDTQFEEIGMCDFLPGKDEAYSSVVERAAQWCSSQADIRICNVQTVPVKISSGEIRNLKMNHMNEGSGYMYYAHVLRVAYTYTRYSPHPAPPPPPRLTCRTFVPQVLKVGLSDCCIPEFETSQQTKERVTAWVRATGAEILNVETSLIPLNSRHELEDIWEHSFYNTCGQAAFRWLRLIRVYTYTPCPEPTPDALPPVPDIQKACCSIL